MSKPRTRNPALQTARESGRPTYPRPITPTEASWFLNRAIRSLISSSGAGLCRLTIRMQFLPNLLHRLRRPTERADRKTCDRSFVFVLCRVRRKIEERQEETGQDNDGSDAAHG